MKKCLVLGCSFTSGSYKIDDRYSGTKEDWLNQIWQEELESRVGWYSYVDWLKKYNTTVIATPAQGYATWAQLFYYLDNTHRLKTGNIRVYLDTDMLGFTYTGPIILGE